MTEHDETPSLESAEERAQTQEQRAALRREQKLEAALDPEASPSGSEPIPEAAPAPATEASGRREADAPATPKQRREHGRSLREDCPLESHAEWSPGAERPDPLALVEEQNADRIDWLVPVRRARMSPSGFTFYRGAARIMASDLAGSPTSGIRTQICGDAHLSNFGMYASPERRLVFDLNDFDETLPGPWEWDVKRLATSLYIAGRFNGLNKKRSRGLARRAVRRYRKAMAELAEMSVLEIWYSMVEARQAVGANEDAKGRRRQKGAVADAMRKDSRHALARLAERVGGEYRIKHEPPLVVRVRELRDESRRDPIRDAILDAFERYKKSVPDDIEHLLEKYRPVDFAIKVVGVGSVGTRCFILLLEGRNRKDPLFLQVKEANRSVLEGYLPRSRYQKSGRRVVEGQRLMQTVSDVFLGYGTAATGRDFYWRQLRDWKGSDDVENATEEMLEGFADIRGSTLARAHARSGDPIAIAGYLGSSESFDRAVAAFAERYARQNDEDFAAFKAEIESGRA